jgi:hypothetical protein
MNPSLFTKLTTSHLVAIIAVIGIAIMSAQNTLNVGYGQTTTDKEKEDVFKVIVTLFGVEPTTGNIVTFVTIDNMSKVKAFDAAKYYIPIEESKSTNNNTALVDAMHGISNKQAEQSGIVELYYAFPNATSIKSGDEFRVCGMVLNDLRMVCDTGVNTPALRAENVDMHLDTAQFLKADDMKGQSVTDEGRVDSEAVEGEEEEEEVVSADAEEVVSAEADTDAEDE